LCVWLMWLGSNPVLWNEHNTYIYGISCESKMYDIYMEMNAWHIVEINSMLWCFVIFIFVHLLFCVEGNGTLEHLARDEVAIAQQVGSILICEIIHLMHYCMYWLMACEPTKFDTDIKFYMHITWWYMVDNTFTLGLIMS